MSARADLAVVATHLRPASGFGGVAESTSELVLAWRRSGLRVEAVTSDATCGPALQQTDFEQVLGAPTRTYRSSLAPRWGFGWSAPAKIFAAISRAHLVYVSGIATWPTTLAGWSAALLRRPSIVAVRGGLMPEHWAFIRGRRPFKALFYRLFVFPILRSATAVHVTSELEAEGVRAILPKVRTVVVPNGVAISSEPARAPPPSARSGLRLLYLGRLSPEKGIRAFAERFAAVRGPQDRLIIAGEPMGDYGASVLELCKTNPGLDYSGVLSRDQVRQALAECHALALPSGADGPIKENFGNVVVEALAAGRLLLVTRGLAWDDLEPEGLGALVARDLSDLAVAIERLRVTTKDASAWRKAHAYALERFHPDRVAADLLKPLQASPYQPAS